MRKHNKIRIYTGILSSAFLLSITGCGNTADNTALETVTAAETEANETSISLDSSESADTTVATEESVSYEVVDADLSVENFITYCNESGKCEGITKEDVSFTTIPLDSNMTVKKWNNGQKIHLVDGHKVISINEEIEFTGVVLEGYIDSDPVSVYFTQDDKGQLVNEDGIRLTSFLTANQLKEF